MKRKKAIRVFVLIGLTSMVLIILALFIIIGEQYGLVEFVIGPELYGLSPLDIWLIIILAIFGPAIFISLYLTYKLKIIDID